LRFAANWVEMEESKSPWQRWPLSFAFTGFMRSRATSLLNLVLIWLALVGGEGLAQQTAPSEYQIKAAFIFNFAKFVDWPPSAFSNLNSPIVIGILGDNPFHDDLARTIHNKTIEDRPLVIEELRVPSEATNCHILFISSSEKDRLPEILKSLKDTSVLTVGEMDHFTESGGMINLVIRDQKIRFQINNGEATKARLKISSKLMNLALRPGG